jgi:hypothetical protein
MFFLGLILGVVLLGIAVVWFAIWFLGTLFPGIFGRK